MIMKKIWIMKYWINILTLVIVFSLSAQAQTKRAFITVAEREMSLHNYGGALINFSEALKFDNLNEDLVYKAATAARLYHAYVYATSKYHLLVDTLLSEKYPDAIFYLGEMYNKLGDYDSAIKYYTMYLSEYSTDNPDMAKEARAMLRSSGSAKILIRQSDPNGTVTRLGDNINSPDSDFGGVFQNGDMYYSSSRFYGTSKALKDKQIYKILVQKPGEMAEMLTGLDKKDRSFGNLIFDKTGTKVYYSVCEFIDGWKQSCSLYSSDVNSKGNFANEIKLPENINVTGYNTTQPSLAEIDGKQYLFFASDRPGGKGGMDIWKTEISNGSYGEPVNITEINTYKDEVTPFYHNGSKILYFSTDGRAGYGGLDVFRLFDGSKEPELLTLPYNSSADDFYFYLDEKNANGFVTSNRSGAMTQNPQFNGCCYDIFNVKIDQGIELDVATLYTKDNSPLNGTTICLVNADTEDILECIENSEDSNISIFNLKRDRNYKIIATKDGYAVSNISFNTRNKGDKMSHKLFLDLPSVTMDVFVYDKKTYQPLEGTTMILKHLTDQFNDEIREGELGNTSQFYIRANNKFELTISKPGYKPETIIIDTEDAMKSFSVDVKLYKEEIKSLLPVSLYFDNDYPDPKSQSKETEAVYATLADDYYKKKMEYIHEFSDPIEDMNIQLKARQEMNDFFENDVIGGKELLLEFLRQLENKLKDGDDVILEIRGYASPRSQADYNQILSNRRVNSMINEFKNFGNGSIRKSLENGQLKLQEVAFGDKSAKSGVVSDIDDLRNSIYNINAARERRVEIIKIKYDE